MGVSEKKCSNFASAEIDPREVRHSNVTVAILAQGSSGGIVFRSLFFYGRWSWRFAENTEMGLFRFAMSIWPPPFSPF